MFLCLINRDGAQVTAEQLAPFMCSMSKHGASKLATLYAGTFAAVTAPSWTPLRPLSATLKGGSVAIGNVRLDNQQQLARITPAAVAATSDLETVLEAIAEHGANIVPQVLGDFAFVVWMPHARTLIAARDGLGVRSLFYSRAANSVVIASHLSAIADERTVDGDFIADFLVAGGTPDSVRTIWANVSAVAPGQSLVIQDDRVTLHRFWCPESFEPMERSDEVHDVKTFRTLFGHAVRSHCAEGESVWAELSGGTDSSSIVSTAETLASDGQLSKRLGGTITIVDDLGEGDERRYSDLVVRRFGIRNDTVTNAWPWQDDGLPPPRTDEPRTFFPFFARDRALCNVVRGAGGRVILSGIGSDHYLTGNRLFLADWVARGRLISALLCSGRWAIAERQSFWKSALRDLVTPLMPRAIKLRQAEPWQRIPAWIEETFADKYALASRLPVAPEVRVPSRSRFSQQVVNSMLELPNWLPRGSYEDGLELRFPFLHRPLVEFGMRLPVRMRTRPLAEKWILREAMRGTLPEPIRTRPGKGGIDARILWALSRERQRILELLRDPFLAQAGCVNPKALRGAVEEAWRGRAPNLVMLLSVLALETWFLVRSGRWVVRSSTTNERRMRSPRDSESILRR